MAKITIPNMNQFLHSVRLSSRRSVGLKNPTIDLSYFDTKTDRDGNDDAKVVLMLHGAPGSHNDFKYIIPLIKEKNIRILAPNEPGYGFSSVPSDYHHSPDERAGVILDFVKEMGLLNRVNIIVSHSAGVFPLLKLSSDKRYWINNDMAVTDAVIIVNPSGARPYKALRPYWIWRSLSRFTYGLFGPVFNFFNYLFWRYILGFRVDVQTACSILRMVANIGFERVPQLFQNLQTQSTPRVLLVYAEDDPIVEKECNEELVDYLGIDIRQSNYRLITDKDDIPEALSLVSSWWEINNQDKKNMAVAFRKGFGGHYLQKFQASFIATCVEIMTKK